MELESATPSQESVNPKPSTCQNCTLYKSQEGIVWGKGPRDAKILILGEAPGEVEGQVLQPFVGGSGRVLSALLSHAGIRRDECFITNTVKCRPTAKDPITGRITDRAPTEVERTCCAPLLLREINTIQPNLILALGNVAMNTLTGTKKGIMQVRSVPIEGNRRTDGKAERYKVVGTFHPAAVMRQQELWPATVYDLVRARTESASPVISRRPWKRVIHARLADIGESLERRIREPRLAGLRYYIHDLETTGLDPRRDTFRCIGLAAEADEVYCLDWTSDVIEFVKKLHRDPTLTVVGQNSEIFDIYFQEEKGFEFDWKGGKKSFDTLTAFHLLNSSLPKDLGFIGASYTDEPYWKDNSMYKAGEDALQHGCCKDIHATGRAFEEEIKELQQTNQFDLYFNHVMPLQPVLRNMTRRGMKKDVRAMVGWHHVLNRKADELEARLKKGLGDSTFNVDSPKQLMDLLYRRMCLPIQYKETREGFRPTVDADSLEDLANNTSIDPALRPILLLVRDIRTLRKWDSTFVMCDHDENHFVHGRFSSSKAANGRLSSFDPNMQNFPVEVREIFVPDTKDHVILSRDWSQIEWRIAMTLAGDKVGLDALASGRDAHKDAYAHAFGLDYDSITKKQRFDAKTINYGVLYGRSAKSLAEGKSGGRSGASRSKAATAIPEHIVKDYLPRFFGKFTGFNQFRKELERQVEKNHFLVSAWGRRRYWYNTNSMPEAYNFPISSAAASMMYEALVELEQQLPFGAELRLTVHDEVVIHSSKEHSVIKQAIECSRDIMERPYPQITDASLYPDVVRHYYPNGWFCESDCHIGENWKRCKGETKEDIAIEDELRKHLGVLDL